MTILQLKFGTLTVGDHYIIGEMNEGESIDIATVSSIIKLANENFKGEPWGYISNRINSYDMNPVTYIEANELENHMVAFAAVTHTPMAGITTRLENTITESNKLNFEFASFTELSTAIDWVKSMLAKASYKIEYINDITKIQFYKAPTYDEAKMVIDDIADNYPYEKRLWDFSNIEFNFTQQQIENIAAYGKLKFIKPNKLAIIAPNDLAFGEMRQFEVHRDETNHATSATFRNEQDALEWLSK